MKHYEKLIELGCFSRCDLVTITGSDAAANSLIHDYLQKGYIERVRRDLYTAISIETKQPVPTRYQIASRLFEDACVSHHSAFEYYGYANQVFYEVYVTTQNRFQSFEYDGVTYHRIAPRYEASAELSGGVRAAGLERTVIDSINDFEKIGGLEETLRCLMLIPALKPDKLLLTLAAYNSGFLYQKSGYLLESLRDSLDLPESFFAECRKHISGSKKYLMKERNNFVWHEKWRLYAPADIRAITNKGVTDDDAI